MKSIWSKGYIPFKDSNQLIIDQTDKINCLTTLGLIKTISGVLNETPKTKRKFESVSQYTSSLSSYVVELNGNKYFDEINNKLLKNEENKKYKFK